MTWSDNAACAPHPMAWWFPEYGVGGQKSPYEQARAICNACPVRQDCLDEALANYEQHGMWGGLTPRERGNIGKKCGTTAGYIRHYRTGEPPCRPCLDSWKQRSVDDRRRTSAQLAAEERRGGAA